jgi:hypothetical protein
MFIRGRRRRRSRQGFMPQAKSAHWRLKHAPGEVGALTSERCVCAAKLRPSLKLFEGKSPRGVPCLRAEDFSNTPAQSSLRLRFNQRIAGMRARSEI